MPSDWSFFCNTFYLCVIYCFIARLIDNNSITKTLTWHMASLYCRRCRFFLRGDPGNVIRRSPRVLLLRVVLCCYVYQVEATRFDGLLCLHAGDVKFAVGSCPSHASSSWVFSSRQRESQQRAQTNMIVVYIHIYFLFSTVYFNNNAAQRLFWRIHARLHGPSISGEWRTLSWLNPPSNKLWAASSQCFIP